VLIHEDVSFVYIRTAVRAGLAAFAQAVGAPPPRRLPAMLGAVVMGETWAE
jgi:hypothetical protein